MVCFLKAMQIFLYYAVTENDVGQQKELLCATEHGQCEHYFGACCRLH